MKRNLTQAAAFKSTPTEVNHDEAQSESYSSSKRASAIIQSDCSSSPRTIRHPAVSHFRKLKLKYIGSFAVTVRYLSRLDEPKSSNENPKTKYFCHSFDQGSLWSSKV